MFKMDKIRMSLVVKVVQRRNFYALVYHSITSMKCHHPKDSTILVESPNVNIACRYDIARGGSEEALDALLAAGLVLIDELEPVVVTVAEDALELEVGVAVADVDVEVGLFGSSASP